MGWLVAGTRERLYRVETPDDVSLWVADVIDALDEGWVPLASDREPDGWLRVIYGQLPPELSGAEHPLAPPVDQDTPGGAVLGTLPVGLVGVGLATTVALSASL